jgi:hypothetical protein
MRSHLANQTPKSAICATQQRYAIASHAVEYQYRAQLNCSYTSYKTTLINGQVMTIYELLQANRERILQTAAKYGAYNVRIFGSVARGEADVSSDVDFLVEMEPGRSLFDLGGLLMDLQELLNCKVDIVTEKGLRQRIRERVLKEAISL